MFSWIKKIIDRIKVEIDYRRRLKKTQDDPYIYK
jgi:hypothetical protein